MADEKAPTTSSKTGKTMEEYRTSPERTPGTREHLGSDRPYEMPGQDEEESK